MMNILYLFIVTFFFGEIITAQKEIIKNASATKNNVLSVLFYDYEKMLNDFKSVDDVLKTEIKIKFATSNLDLRPRGYDLLKIIEEYYFRNEDELVEYMNKLYEYFNSLVTTQIEELKKHIGSIAEKKEEFSDGTEDLRKVQNVIPESELNKLYEKYNIEKTKRNMNNLIHKIRETLKENLKILKQEVKLIEKFLLIKHLPLYFEELFKEFKEKEVLKPIFEKIKKLSEEMKKENIDEHKKKEDGEVTKLENAFNEEYSKTDKYVKDITSAEPIQSVDPPLSVESSTTQQPNDNEETVDQHVNPSNTPSHATDDLQHLKKNGESTDQKHTNKKRHHSKISELLEKYKDKISAASSNISSTGKSTEDGKTYGDINAVNILKLIEIIKDNEQELTEVTKDIESLVTEIQNEKESLDKMYSKLTKTRSGTDNAETAANITLADKALQEYLKLKKEAEFYLEKLSGKSKNSLNNAKNQMNFTIQNIMAILAIITFLF